MSYPSKKHPVQEMCLMVINICIILLPFACVYEANKAGYDISDIKDNFAITLIPYDEGLEALPDFSPDDDSYNRDTLNSANAQKEDTLDTKVCFTPIKSTEKNLCFELEEIIKISIEFKKSIILFDYTGEGFLIKERLIDVNRMIDGKDYDCIIQVNRRCIANMRYVIDYNEKSTELSFVEDFDESVGSVYKTKVEEQYYSCTERTFWGTNEELFTAN